MTIITLITIIKNINIIFLNSTSSKLASRLLRKISLLTCRGSGQGEPAQRGSSGGLSRVMRFRVKGLGSRV